MAKRAWQNTEKQWQRHHIYNELMKRENTVILWKKVKKAVFLGALLAPGICAYAADGKESDIFRCYQEYQENFEEIAHLDDIESRGYDILDDQVFTIKLESFEQEEVTLIPALEISWNRLALFLADGQGNILYKCNDLETNNCARGRMLQNTQGIVSIAFDDANQDGRTDIILISRCVNDTGDYAGIPYKVGDVLFQGEDTFYRDWRISDKINRFGMNKSTNQILFFVRDGRSTEFLYTATTLDELLEHGFYIIEEQYYTRNFEKLGRLKVVPGTFRMAWYDIFLIYLVNEQGDIVWSLQPMGDYDGLYSLKGINGRDVDGDGLKDLVVLARYSREDENGERQIENKCMIYYQRTSGFEADTEFENYYQYAEEDTMEMMIQKIREYWGWQVEE